MRQLARGYFGQVWLEEDLALGRMCAAKYLDPALLGAGSFAEARAMLDAVHDHVVQIYAAEEESVTPGAPPVPVIRMEYLPAGSLQARYGGAAAAAGDAVRAIEDAARGVEALHSRGALHRDLKPGNLLIADDGRIKVSDFGLACQAANAAGAPAWGYLRHLPPEAIAGSGTIDTVAGDIFALGVTAYRLLNGDAMLDAAHTPGRALLGLIAQGRYPNRARWQLHIHDRLRRVVRKAMHLKPDHRHSSASQLRHALEQVHPAVSWLPVAGSAEGSWEGIHEATGSLCAARIERNHRGEYVFELQRQGPQGKLRTSRADSLIDSEHDVVLHHASIVLQRVATGGR